MDRQLTGLDSAFLALETNAAPMHMTAMVILDPSAEGPATFEDIRAHLAPRLGRIPVFRRHLQQVPLGLDHPRWIEGDFDLDAHVHRAGVPQPGSLAEVASLVGHLAGLPLDRARPLWDLWIVEGLGQGRTALVMKVHHALIDGVAGAEIFGRLFDLEPDAPVSRTATKRRERAASRRELLFAGARSLAGKPYQVARQSLGSIAAAGRGLWRSTRGEGGPMLPAALSAAPDTPLNGAITARREVALASVSLEDFQPVRRAFGVKLNDVVLAVCAGALRRYLGDEGTTSDDPLVAAIPISVSRGEGTSARTDGNRISAMTVELPVHLDDPGMRLSKVHRLTLRAKRAHRAIGGDLLSGWADVVPPALLSGLSQVYSRLNLADRHRPVANLVVSNVPGPPVSLYCAGHRVQACYPLGPIYEGFGLNVTVMSYDGRLDFGLTGCPDVVPNLGRISEALQEAASELREVAA